MISSTSEDAGYIWDERQAHHSIVGGVPILMNGKREVEIGGMVITNRKDIIIFNQRMAGYLMLRGYVLLGMRPDINSSNGKNVFIFKDTPQIRNSMSDYLNH